MNFWRATEPKNSFHILSDTDQIQAVSRGVRGTVSRVYTHKARFILALFVIATLTVSCSQSGSAGQATTGTPEPPVETAATTTPQDNNTVRNDVDLANALDPLLAAPEYATARWGVAVVSLPDGRLLYGRNHDKLFTPASNMKIYTTAVALDLLGADYRWRTSVFADRLPDNTGTISGDIVLYGRGAPDLVSENRRENLNSLEELARSLVARGIKHVAGNVIGDESYFRGEPIGDGWQQNDLQWYFGAEASALTVNDNSADVSIVPAQKITDPVTVSVNDHGADYVHVTNHLTMVESGKEFQLGVQRGLSDNDVVVWGEVPVGARGYGASLSVHRPALWAARLFLKSLQAHGITVDGSAISRDWRVPQNERLDPASKQELAFVTSATLAEIAKQTNKRSINLYAELILRTLGRERAAMLGAAQPNGRERQDEEAGAELIRLWLARSGVKSERLAIHDGSGLSRLDLVTPESAAGLLAAITRTSVGPVFADSLPVAGTDGTLMGRLPTLTGKVMAKTGAIIYDHALSGYLTTSAGKKVAFSVISNDFVNKGSAVSLVDRLVTSIANPSTSPSLPPTSGQTKRKS